MRLTLALLLLSFLVSPGRADPLDDWCKAVRLPSSIAICSDPDLRALARERQQAFDKARARLSPEGQKELLADQNAWVHSYAHTCGLSDRPPTLPLAPEIKNCMARAGRARIAYLRAYGSSPASPSSSQKVPQSPQVLQAEKAMQAQPTPQRAAGLPPAKPTWDQLLSSVMHESCGRWDFLTCIQYKDDVMQLCASQPDDALSILNAFRYWEKRTTMATAKRMIEDTNGKGDLGLVDYVQSWLGKGYDDDPNLAGNVALGALTRCLQSLSH
jgi:uncharacterized protein